MLSALYTARLYVQDIFLVTQFSYRLSQPQGHSAAGRIMSMKISNDTIGNRTRVVPRIFVTNMLLYLLYFAPGRKAFELKRFVIFCLCVFFCVSVRHTAVAFYKFYICGFMSRFTGLSEMFRSQTRSKDQT